MVCFKPVGYWTIYIFWIKLWQELIRFKPYSDGCITRREFSLINFPHHNANGHMFVRNGEPNEPSTPKKKMRNHFFCRKNILRHCENWRKTNIWWRLRHTKMEIKYCPTESTAKPCEKKIPKPNTKQSYLERTMVLAWKQTFFFFSFRVSIA